MVWWVILHVVPNIRLGLIWRVPKEAWNPECLVPSVKHGGGSVMIWVAISWYCAGPINALNGRITASGYIDILGNQVHAVVQMLFPDSAVFQDDISPIHSQKCSFLDWGAWICTSTSSSANTIARFNYHQITVVSFREYSEKQIPSSIISQVNTRCSTWRVVPYSTRDYSERMWIYSKEDTNYYSKMVVQFHVNK